MAWPVPIFGVLEKILPTAILVEPLQERGSNKTVSGGGLEKNSARAKNKIKACPAIAKDAL